MACQNDPIVTLQVLNHDDAFDDIPPLPYHTRFFDVMLRPLPPSNLPSEKTQRKPIIYSNFVSIISYEDAIITAIMELHDVHIGSSISEIKKHMVDNFIKETFPYLDKADTNATFNYLKRPLFLAALKSLLDKRVIVPHSYAPVVKNGLTTCCYKLSKSFVRKRLKLFNKRLWILEQIRDARKRREYDLIMTKKERKHVPARIKPPLHKIHLLDQVPGVVVVENEDTIRKKKKRHEMELDDGVKKVFLFSSKLGLHFKKAYVTKRKTSCKRRLKLPIKKKAAKSA